MNQSLALYKRLVRGWNNTSFDPFKKESLFQLSVQMIHHIHSELQDDLPEKGLVLQSYFSLLLCSIYRLSVKRSEKLIPADTQAVQYFQAFHRSVKQSSTLKKTINTYARELNISPVHLNRVCQATTPISEIAYRLNFEDPAFLKVLL